MRGPELTSAAAALGLMLVAFTGQPAAAQATEPGEYAIQGELASGDTLWIDGSYVDCYRLPVTRGSVATVILHTEAFAPYLAIMPQSGCNNIEQQGYGDDVEISPERRGRIIIFEAQQDGYSVAVNSERPGETGPYVLLVRIAPPSANP